MSRDEQGQECASSGRVDCSDVSEQDDRAGADAFLKAIRAKVAGRIRELNSEDDVRQFISVIRGYLQGAQVRGALYDTEQLIDDDVAIDGPAYKSEYSGILRLHEITKQVLEVAGSIVAVVETNYIDSVYRNLIYHWYSRRVTNVPRFSLRISFFENDFAEEINGDFLFNQYRVDKGRELLEERFIGSTVMCPLGDGLIGRTLLSPKYLISKDAYMRLARYELKIYGYKLSIEAFPFRMQDAEVMSCAETTIINLMEYYSSSYPAYAMVKPSDLTKIEEEGSSERAVPAKGIDYSFLSQILGRLGFYPRLQTLPALKRSSRAIPGEVQLSRQLYWYLASGIPAAVNLVPSRREKEGHSLIVSGFADCPESIVEAMQRNLATNAASESSYPMLVDRESNNDNGIISLECKSGKRSAPDRVTEKTLNRMKCSGWYLTGSGTGGQNPKVCRIFQEADFPWQFVTIDDCGMPYAIRPYERLSNSGPLTCENIAVPLHEGMALDAQDAFDIFEMVLKDSNVGILKWAGNSIGDDEAVIMRMFLLTAGSYRGFRAQTSNSPLRYLYETQVLPHFVWVAELVLLSDYSSDTKSCKSFAEVVLDATVSGKTSFEDKLLIMRYPRKFAWREPNDPEGSFGKNCATWGSDSESSVETFPSYTFALNHIRKA